ncbi:MULTISPECIES: virB8 family protein [Stenotrophomonas]|uniref:Conjugative transfer protein n=1 Tax=Stenotrophomonas maltophilia TaxID=40324 RepID=A0AAD0BXJ7_STEMA|nr:MULTISPECIES: type IV secretion system protein [Stenotrophomonas]AUI08127.1 conjugative transfer protein [Stenotrophomonas maltophilia]MBA2128537.1 type IV secretion system protein [Stenotrophomonas maltophilia]MBH1680836.1 conjugative transfer protein [Stenotrophomonas maltophilia]MBH1874396.1 conjugative transfer protein [Stenotrophomonas maltophilia]RIA32859.1 type IV secretion system protein VirB8 [Stenotrophomonas sp. AG209]
MFRKKDPGNSPKVEQSVAKAVSYEITVADMARRSERRAWWVATGSLLMSLALAGGYYYMLPLKEKVPFLVMADAYTGTATVARLSGTFQGETITTNEAINRSNVAQYVLARESYDSAVMGLRDWELVFVMSTDPVAQSMRVRYAGNNPQNPFVMYGRERAIRVKILSITPLGAEPNGSFRGASVRIQRSLLDKRTGVATYLDNQLVTMRFGYNQNLALSEQDRILNPLAFQVTEYRVDNDYSRGVPVPDDGAMQAQAQQAAQQAQGVYDPNNPAAATMIDPATGQPVAVPANGQVPGQPMQGQPVQGQPMPGQPVQGQAMPGQVMPGQPAMRPAQNNSTGTADGASNR